jgi:hypothetical protein
MGGAGGRGVDVEEGFGGSGGGALSARVGLSPRRGRALSASLSLSGIFFVLGETQSLSPFLSLLLSLSVCIGTDMWLCVSALALLCVRYCTAVICPFIHVIYSIFIIYCFSIKRIPYVSTYCALYWS